MDKSPKTIGGMFDRIAPVYDLLNRILSLSIDLSWRRKAVDHLDVRDGERVLDIATGTGDLAIAALKRNPVCRVVGIDLSREMLRVAARKRRTGDWKDNYLLLEGDACRMPLKDGAFDKAMVAFGVRNVPDVGRLLRETGRVLKEGGKLAILELSVPDKPAVRGLYLLYFNKLLPMIGSFLSGRSVAYGYLRDSVLDFYKPRQLEALLDASGFAMVKSVPLSFGISHLYLAEKGHLKSERQDTDGRQEK